MRDDLLPAQAAVDWAVSQFPTFEQRLNVWLNNNINVSVKELPADTPNNIIVATEKEPLPLAFLVEAGAYINVIRSSLDILASALARRYRIPDIDDVYFPVAVDAKTFASNGYKGSKFVQSLPAVQRDIIKYLKPYKGGNDTLYALHRLDIVRKHKRLFEVEVIPSTMRLKGNNLFIPVSTGYMRSADDETVLGLIAKGHLNPVTEYTARVIMSEDINLPVIAALALFARLASSIIAMFDTP
jgi:hypothetical protein